MPKTIFPNGYMTEHVHQQTMTKKVFPTFEKQDKIRGLKMCDLKTYFKGKLIKTIWQWLGQG